MAKPLFWIDLEMTGLDENVDTILEVAILITDVNFNTLDTYHRVVFQPPAVLEAMNDWCKKTHGESGLTAAVATGTPLAQVDEEVLALIEKHYAPTDRVVLVGNSVNNDKRFVDKYMSKVAPRLHYRLIDVSSFKEIFREKYGINFQKEGNNAHRALDDIQKSVQELAFYLTHVKVPTP